MSHPPGTPDSSISVFSGTVSVVLKEQILTVISGYIKSEHGIDVTVEEMMKVLSISEKKPPANPSAKLPVKPPAKSSANLPVKSPGNKGTCQFPVSKGERKGQPCGKAVDGNPLFCKKCMGYARFLVHAPAIVAENGYEWSEIMGIPLPVDKKSSKTPIKVPYPPNRKVPVALPVPKKEKPVQVVEPVQYEEEEIQIKALKDHEGFFSSGNKIFFKEGEEYILFGYMEGQDVRKMTEAEEKSAEEDGYDIGEYSKYISLMFPEEEEEEQEGEEKEEGKEGEE